MNFEDLIAKVKTCGKQKLAVAAAEDDAVLEAVDAAHKQGIADAILVGDEAAIRKIAGELNIDLSDYEIINEPDKVQASLKAVKLAHDGVANMYMKGLLDTKTFLKSVLDKEVGLRTGHTSYPNASALALYHDLGGEILTLGSDAHTPEDASVGIREGAELLRTVGFRYYTVFEQRKPTFLSLE